MTTDLYQGLTKAPAEGQPIVFALHGTGGDEHQFFGLTEQIMPEAGIVAPHGDVSEMGANRFFRRTREGVYDVADLARATQKMADFVQAYKDTHPGAPIYGYGYSNGANILAAVVIGHPGLFDRVGLLHPLIPWDPEPVAGLDQTRVLISAGQRDPITPWARSAALVDWFVEMGADVTTEVHDGGHELRQGEVEALAKLLRG